MSDLNLLVSLAVLVAGAVAAGGWVLFSTRTAAASRDHNSQPDIHDEIDTIRRRVDLISEAVEKPDRIRIVVRNSTTGQFRGAAKRTARTIASRIPAE